MSVWGAFDLSVREAVAVFEGFGWYEALEANTTGKQSGQHTQRASQLLQTSKTQSSV